MNNFDLHQDLRSAMQCVDEMILYAKSRNSNVKLYPDAQFGDGDYNVYVHYKNNGEPFYIGICSNSNLNKRPYEISNRSDIWKRTQKKYGRRGSILLTNVSKDFAIATEKWLISFFGKRLDGGMLSNITDGGEGSSGYRHTEESRKKMSMSKFGKTGDLCKNSNPVMCEGIRYGSIAEAGRQLGLSTQTVLNRTRSEKYPTYYKL